MYVCCVRVQGYVPTRFKHGQPVEYSQPKELRRVGGRMCVLEDALRGDVALIRAWKGDTLGEL